MTVKNIKIEEGKTDTRPELTMPLLLDRLSILAPSRLYHYLFLYKMQQNRNFTYSS